MIEPTASYHDGSEYSLAMKQAAVISKTPSIVNNATSNNIDVSVINSLKKRQQKSNQMPAIV